MVDPWLQTCPHLLSQTGEVPSPSWPLCCSDHSNKASWRGAGAPAPPLCPCGWDRGGGSSCSPWSFPGTSIGGARCSPHGWGRAVSPRGLWGCMEEVPPCPTPPPVWHCSAFPEHCWCSGHCWTTSSGPLARGRGRGNQAANKEQRFNVSPVCALSLDIPGDPAPRPSPCSAPSLHCPWPDPQCLSPSLGTGLAPRWQREWEGFPWPLGPGCKGLCVQWDLGTIGTHSPVLGRLGIPWDQGCRGGGWPQPSRSCGEPGVPQGKGETPVACSVPGLAQPGTQGGVGVHGMVLGRASLSFDLLHAQF